MFNKELLNGFCLISYIDIVSEDAGSHWTGLPHGKDLLGIRLPRLSLGWGRGTHTEELNGGKASTFHAPIKGWGCCLSGLTRKPGALF